MALTTLTRLEPYTRRVRPNDPAGLASYMDEEFRRIETSSRDIVAAIKDLDSRLKSIGR